MWSIYLLIMSDTLLLRLSLHFTPLHYTFRHFNSSHFNFTQLHFTTFSFGLTPLKFPTAPFHLTSLHFTSLHFTALVDHFGTSLSIITVQVHAVRHVTLPKFKRAAVLKCNYIIYGKVTCVRWNSEWNCNAERSRCHIHCIDPILSCILIHSVN